MSDQVQAKRPRADAERNRARLLGAAKAAFASAQAPVMLEQIARAAEVGDRHALPALPRPARCWSRSCTGRSSRPCAPAAADLLAAQPPVRALRAWMDLFADYVRR